MAPIICSIFRPVKTNDELDLLIVGQGLAGSALAMRALAKGLKIMVMDTPSANSSSRVAAGLFNPITGRKMAKTWLADTIFPALHQYYREVERITGSKFLHAMPIYRTFHSVEEQNEWMSKSGDEGYRDFIENVSGKSAFGEKVYDGFGGMTLKQSGYLDTRAYMDAVRSYLEAGNAYRETIFDAAKLEIDHDSVQYGQFKARRIVFCQGIANRTNPWFGHLPIKPLKGEFLTVQCAWEKRVILNRGIYMVPGAGLDEWRVGATFNRNDEKAEISTGAREELSRKLEGLIRMPFTVTGQQWGFRPTTPDRRPILGAHPEYRSLVIFNGLGTKGVSLAPYFSEVLIRWMENKGTINKEADVSRF